MIDTTSINYAINKVSEGWAKVAPTIQDAGEKYVRYVVTKEMVQAGIVALFTVIVAGATALAFKKAQWGEGPEGANAAAFALSVVLFFLLLVPLVEGVWMNAILAYTNPEMFAVHQIIKAAK